MNRSGASERRIAGHLAAMLAMALMLFLGTLALRPTPAMASTSADVSQFLADTNHDRAAAGVAPLTMNAALAGVAQRWSDQLAASAHLAHNPNLFSQIDRYVTPNWTKAGENVGTGPDEAAIQAAFDRSAEHHDNIVDPAYTEVGIAVSYGSNGALWVTVDFLQPVPTRQVTAASAAPTPPVASAPVTVRRPVAALPAVTSTLPPASSIPATSAVTLTPPTTAAATTIPAPAPSDVPLAAGSIPVTPRPSPLPRLLEMGDGVLIAGIVVTRLRLRSVLA